MKFSILPLSLLAIAAWAQPAPPTPPPVAEVQAYLALTDAQLSNLETAQQALQITIASISGQIQVKQQTLNQQLAAGGTSATLLGQELLEIQALINSVTQAQAAAQTQAVSLLTADQKTKLAALAAAANLRPPVEEAIGLGLLTVPATASGPQAPGSAPVGAAAALGMRRQ